MDNAKITFRTIGDDDLELLLRIYAATRQAEIAQTNFTAPEAEEFLRSQFWLQHSQYMNNDNYEGATFDIILHDKEAAGRLYLHRREERIHIIDIALLPEFQGNGIGTWIMNGLVEEADQKNMPLSLYVERFNPALSFYERLGMQRIKDEGVYLFLERPPAMIEEKKGSVRKVMMPLEVNSSVIKTT